MYTRWRWVLFGLGAGVAVSGPIAMAGGPWYGYVFGTLWFVMGGAVAWRSFAMGTKLTEDGIVSTNLEGRTVIPWCSIDVIEPNRRRNLIFFHTIAPVVKLRHKGAEKLTELSLLSVKKDSVPERTGQHVVELQNALRQHRANCPTCGAQQKALPASQSIFQRLWSRLRSGHRSRS